jgi:hypothetical protein
MRKPTRLTHITNEEWNAMTEDQQITAHDRWVSALTVVDKPDRHDRLVAYVKELAAQFNALERRVLELEREVQGVDADVSQLKRRVEELEKANIELAYQAGLRDSRSKEKK